LEVSAASISRFLVMAAYQTMRFHNLKDHSFRLQGIGKIKVKFTLELATKARGRESLTLALDEVGWSTPRPGRFIPVKDPVYIM
jgi:hypothetical protein